MKIKEILIEGVAGPKNCWPGYRKTGTQPGTGKNKGKRVNDCEKIKEDVTELDQEFDMIEETVAYIADQNGVDVNRVWEDLESLSDDELYVFAVTQHVMEDWQKANKKDKTDGMSQKAVNAYRRENPGSKLKTAVTTKPSKLKAGSKDAKRRKSFCARMSGNKGPMKDEKGRPTPKAKALSRWNCE